MIGREPMGGTELVSAFLDRRKLEGKRRRHTNTYVTSDGREQDFLAISPGTYWHRPCFSGLASYHCTFLVKMLFHSVIWVLTRADSYWCVTEGALMRMVSSLDAGKKERKNRTRHTIWSDPVVLAFIVLRTFVGRYHKMFLAKSIFAVLAFEW